MLYYFCRAHNGYVTEEKTDIFEYGKRQNQRYSFYLYKKLFRNLNSFLL